MKRFTIIVALVLLAATNGWAQSFNYGKIAADLLEEINASSKSDELFQTIIIMDEQFDAQKSTRQMQYLNKAQQREFVVDELQRIATNGQQEILKDLQAGQKSALVDDIHSFWIVNGISCSMTKDMIKGIAARPDVKFVMKDVEFHITDGAESEPVVVEKDVDPNTWNVTQVNADAVWSLGYTGQGVIVAVIDSGVNYNHTDIANNMWDGGSEYPNHGWDFINSDNDPMDDNGHGTHCAGTVSSYGTNGKQCGIAKDAKIMALKVLDANGHGSSNYTIPAIEFAVSHGADILSMSLGGNNGGFWPFRVALENVLHCGVIASVSAGNEGDNMSTYPIPLNVGSPGNCPSPWRHPDQTLEGGHSAVVAVGATTIDDIHSSFSSYGPSTWAEGTSIGFYNDYPLDNTDPTKIGLIKPDISAPGSGIISLLHSSNDGYRSMNGTSMAAPCVAGVMALMLQANPTLTPLEIDSIIETTAVACEGQTTKNNTYGSGRIDALAAINYMRNACATPTNLTATVKAATVTLNWEVAESVASYCIYRNGVRIAKSVFETTFTDINAPAGINTYFIRSNGDNHQASLPSNRVTVDVTTNAEFDAPINLVATEINTTGSTLTLNWDAPTAHESTVCYVTSGNNYSGVPDATITAAQRFPSSLLQPYAGMQIEHVFFSLQSSGATCTITLYEGDKMQPGTKIYEDNFTTTEAEQKIDYILSAPIVINPNKDLWLTISTTDNIQLETNYCGEIGDAFMYTYSSAPHWYSYDGCAWAFQLGLSTIDYSYNVYCNDIAVSSNQIETSYTNSYANGLNSYRVTAVSNSYESPVSNTIMVVNNTVSLSGLTVNNIDNLIILPNSTLTITGTLTNANAANLIIEDGGQLITSSENVLATVKKNIVAAPNWGEGNYTADGWYFIASPIVSTNDYIISGMTTSDETVNENTIHTFDLYRYNESADLEWENYWEHHSNESPFTIDNGAGYLYASKNGTTIRFEGVIKPYSTTSNQVTLTQNGWNLIGNPFTCVVTVDHAFAELNYGSSVTYKEANCAINPCAGIAVYGEANEKVTFSKVEEQSTTPIQSSLNIILAQQTENRNGTLEGTATIDNAIISFKQGNQLGKFHFGEKKADLYIPKNEEKYAIVSSDGQNEIPLNFKAAKDGTYVLDVETNNLNLDYLHLIDNRTGADVDLLATPSYSFEAKTTDYASRFRLVFACEDTNDDNNTPFAYVSNGEIVIPGDAGTASIQVVDMMGRVLVCRDALNASPVSIAGIPAGLYILHLVTADGVKAQKIVIE